MKKILLSLLLVIVLVITCPISALAYNKIEGELTDEIIREYLDNAVYSWNNRSAAQRAKYDGASTCVAFARYAFNNAFGHSGHSSNKNNIFINKTGYNANDLINVLNEWATVGDIVIVPTHTFIFGGFDSKGNLIAYESNLTDIAKLKSNKAWKAPRDYSIYLDGQYSNDNFFKRLRLTSNKKYSIRIVHSKYNIRSSKSNTSICEHDYDGLGICTLCGYEYKLKIKEYNYCVSMYFVKDDKPDHTAPYGEAEIVNRYNYGDEVLIVAETTNCYGNKWYRTDHDDTWIVYDYLSRNAPIRESNTVTAKDYQSENSIVNEQPLQIEELKENNTQTVNVESISVTDISINKAVFTCVVTKPQNTIIRAIGYELDDNPQFSSKECYQVFKSPTDSMNKSKEFTFSINGFPYIDGGTQLKPNKTYYWYGYAVDSDGNLHKGDIMSFKTP